MDFLPRATQKVEIKILFGHHAGNYSTYVDQVDNRAITLAHPTVNGGLIPLGAGHAVRLEYTQTGCKVAFNSRVIGTVDHDGIPVIKVAVPDRSEVERQQLRDFVRQEATLSLTFKVLSAPDSETNPRPDVMHSSRTKDVSGSGAQVMCPEAYPPRTQLQIKLDVAGTVLHLVGEVIRPVTQVREKEWWVALRFVGMSERDRDVIIRYIFNLQRDLRRKGLLGN